VAVKKTAEKLVVKKAPAKRAPVKKAVAKKVVAKKAVVNQAPVKKAVAKKVVANQAPMKKVVAKKAVAKKAPAKKAVAKKAPAKRAVAKKAPAKRAALSVLISDASLGAPIVSISSTPIVSTLFAATPEPATKVSSAIPVAQNSPAPEGPQKSSSRVVLLVIVGVILIAILVVARNHNTSVNNSEPNKTPAATASASDTSSPTSMTTSSATPSATKSAPSATTTDLAPVKIVAQYTSFGATVFWAPDPRSHGLTTYNVETAKNGGAFKLLATVPATQTTLDVTKSDVVGWTSFKISAVYSDGGVVAGKVFGLPGQFS
jgi:hypothetical protein